MRKIVALLLIFSTNLLFGVDSIPAINLNLTAPNTPEQLVTSLNLLIGLTVLVLAPSILFVATSFLRLIVVFSFLRQALGTQQTPPNQVLVSLALILTFFIMEPIAKQSYEVAVKPYLAHEIGFQEALEKGIEPFKAFMVRNTREKDLALFFRIRGLDNPQTIDDVPLTIAVPAFIISELKTAFQIGFLLYLPFLVIDMVVASVLMSMGMMMLPPVMISLPFKLLVFVMADGWNILVGSLVESFH